MVTTIVLASLGSNAIEVIVFAPGRSTETVLTTGVAPSISIFEKLFVTVSKFKLSVLYKEEPLAKYR